MTKKVAILVADGTEPIEALAPADILRRGNVDVAVVSAMHGEEVTFAHGVKCVADKNVADVDLDDFDMLVVPGGSVGVANLAACKKLSDALKAFISEEKFVASICAGPTILADLGLLKGRKATCYPGCEDAFPAGVYQDVRGVVCDSNLITASGPGQAIVFGLAMLEALRGKEAADSVASGMLVK